MEKYEEQLRYSDIVLIREISYLRIQTILEYTEQMKTAY